MNQIASMLFFFGLIAGSFLVFMKCRADLRDVELLLKFSENPESRSFLLYKSLSLQPQHAFHLLLSLVTAGGWLIPWWRLTRFQSSLQRQLEDAAARTL